MANADHLALIYCGTDSTITYLTPSCSIKVPISAKLKKFNTEVKRKYKGYMTDYQKDLSIKILTGSGYTFAYADRFDVAERMNQEKLGFEQLEELARNRGDIDRFHSPTIRF